MNNREIRDFKQLNLRSTKLDIEGVNSDLGYTAKRRMAVSMRECWPDHGAGVKLSTSLLTVFFDGCILADVNRILCANHLPDVKSDFTVSLRIILNFYASFL